MTRWLALHVGGQKWSIYLVSPKSKYLLSDGDRCQGLCDYNTCKIFLDRSLSEPALEDTLIHELFHAANYVSGAEDAYNKDPSVEERIVRALTPIWHRVLKDLGLRFPAR